MEFDQRQSRTWREAFESFLHARVITMLFFGFSAGIPLLLIFSSLSLWLREAGADRSEVTFFSWAALAYSFKFVWAPLVDRLPIPYLSRRLGRRRSWLLLAQLSVMGAITWMAMIDPAADSRNLMVMALAAVFLGFSAATQDIVIDAYRIESADPDLQAMMSSSYIAGYRVGMIAAGAGALFLASHFGTEAGAYSYAAWRYTYLIMALGMLLGVLTTLMIDEPQTNRVTPDEYSVSDYFRFLLLFFAGGAGFIAVFFLTADLVERFETGLNDRFVHAHVLGFFIEALRILIAALVAVIIAWFSIRAGLVNRIMVRDGYLAPLSDFFDRYGLKLAVLLLALIGFYRISDIVLGVIANVFYQDIGFSKTEIAAVVKTFGLIMTIAGGFLGGILSAHYGVMRILFLGAVLTVLTNLLFMIQAWAGHDLTVLYLVISADNLTAGLASAAFVAFLSSLTSVSFTAVQYAIFSSLMTLFPKLLGGYSGTMVEAIGYSNFFLVASLMGLPVLLLVRLADRHLSPKDSC
ncbi:MAG: MFS transporter [Methylococcaceae bacterium]|nr:MFS transporter [Methylococcaceae bacterium]MCI0733721.1 MFS transporter [Methylococcaceae bacterium]